jgi:4-hydroxybenzoate polyprenyltransferase
MDHAWNGPGVAAVGADTGTIDTTAVRRAASPLGLLIALVALTRPRHWVKAVVVLAPLGTAPLAVATHASALGFAVLSFLAASSAVYVFNDLRDREADRLHPVKRLRPLASGRVGPGAAVALLVALVLATAGAATRLPPLVGLIVAGYLVVNLGYCLWLKRQPLVDVSVVASGFVLRVLAGTLAVGLKPQPFLLLCVYCACVALSLGKRRHELAGLPPDGSAQRHRPALAAYSVQFLDHVVVVNLVAALVGYTAFVWLSRPPYGALTAVLTFPFATFTVYRYLQMLMVDRSGGDPVVDLLGDRAMRVTVGLWAAVLVPTLVVSLL